jgi:hypothetical protein
MGESINIRERQRRDFYLNALNNKDDIEDTVAIFQEDYEEEWK